MMSGDGPRHTKEVCSKKKCNFFFEILTLVPHFGDSSSCDNSKDKNKMIWKNSFLLKDRQDQVISAVP